MLNGVDSFTSLDNLELSFSDSLMSPWFWIEEFELGLLLASGSLSLKDGFRGPRYIFCIIPAPFPLFPLMKSWILWKKLLLRLLLPEFMLWLLLMRSFGFNYPLLFIFRQLRLGLCIRKSGFEVVELRAT